MWRNAYYKIQDDGYFCRKGRSDWEVMGDGC